MNQYHTAVLGNEIESTSKVSVIHLKEYVSTVAISPQHEPLQHQFSMVFNSR
uniref:Uncharacterized protein n=1 Tax=Arundo donax TaxID=35708 RepID=A0A0A8Z085_ARUDO